MASQSTSYFHRNILQSWGKEGQAWLKKLPIIIEDITQAWQLYDLTQMKNLSYNYLMSGKQRDRHIVLKVGFDPNEISREYHALSVYSKSSINAYDYSPEHNALLLEYAEPGVPLSSLFPHDDTTALKSMIDVMHNLHQTPIPNNHNFQTIEDWLSILDKPSKHIETSRLKTARKLRDSLLSSQGKPVLLHGDLHHDNILKHGDSWVAIDPKGVIGEAAFEVGAFVKNPLFALQNHPEKQKIIDFRLTLFSELLGISHERLKNWFFVQMVMYELFS